MFDITKIIAENKMKYNFTIRQCTFLDLLKYKLFNLILSQVH